ncbi:histone deacetylase family protein [Desulfogranum mediterraneum]|uniref:histone deacetylase family protein n=1 Tax=Desulfogranum mediterraneum TaxID=160661 RepID=UPI00040BE1B2|nr:histone deacetylase [Desulfogranum mediterraneum]
MRRTAIYRDPLFQEHKTGAGHPESPQRLEAIYRELERPELTAKLLFPDFSAASLEDIRRNHSARMIQEVAATAGKAAAYLDADTRTSARSYEAALLAAGALIDGINRLLAGRIDNGFALVRPPGHHAEQDRSMGFCLFNSLAVAARWAIKVRGLKRICVLDWDLHHGNGTQKSFYGSDKVLFCSFHQYPHYPGSGALGECGEGRGLGYTINVPLAGGQGDAAYAGLINDIFLPVARSFQPELILVSVGFDIALGDPLGAMRVSPAGLAYMTRALVGLAEQVCGGKLLLTLEGGYGLEAGHQGSLAVLSELYGAALDPAFPVYLGISQASALAAAPAPAELFQEVRRQQQPWWQL